MSTKNKKKHLSNMALNTCTTHWLKKGNKTNMAKINSLERNETASPLIFTQSKQFTSHILMYAFESHTNFQQDN